MTDIELDRITITRTMTDHDVEIDLEMSAGVTWLDALGMLTAAQLTLVDGMPEQED